MTRKPPHSPLEVIPEPLAGVVDSVPYWFVIGGHAVRCLAPYRPSRDVDFGVGKVRDLRDLLEHLGRAGQVEMVERSEKTVHLRWNGINVSIFVLDKLLPFTEGRRLTVEGILATKLHAILDRGTRRDFFDVYVTLHTQRLGLAACLNALERVYGQRINHELLLRALTYFDDAEREAPLPGEGKSDWQQVRAFFTAGAAALLVPPRRRLEIEERAVDLLGSIRGSVE